MVKVTSLSINLHTFGINLSHSYFNIAHKLSPICHDEMLILNHKREGIGSITFYKVLAPLNYQSFKIYIR